MATWQAVAKRIVPVFPFGLRGESNEPWWNARWEAGA